MDNHLEKDLLLSLLISALDNYRHDTVLRPFPPMCVNDETNEKDYAELRKLCQTFKRLERSCIRDKKAQDVLHWLIDSAPFELKACATESTFADILKRSKCVSSSPTPSYIFELDYKEIASERFESLRSGRPVFYAFHGSQLENFHCILRQGLQSHRNKNSLFGEGTYLSTEIPITMAYAPFGTGWKHSQLGPQLSCIACCEIIDDHSVKCQTKTMGAPTTSTSSQLRNRKMAANSMGGEIPEKYYLVQNNDMIRVKYLLVYAQSMPKRKRSGRLSTWCASHKVALTLLFYMALLLVIGFYNSSLYRKLKRQYLADD